MKRYLLAVPIGLIVVLLAAAYMVGLTPAFIIYGPSVGAGIGAKLLCSAEYVMGHSRAQAFDDLVQYSPILAQLSVSYEPESQAVTASLFGLSETTATYIPGLGCAVDYSGFNQRQTITTQASEHSTHPGLLVLLYNPSIRDCNHCLMKSLRRTMRQGLIHAPCYWSIAATSLPNPTRSSPTPQRHC